jgi:alpha-1,2-mannosyltransferase
VAGRRLPLRRPVLVIALAAADLFLVTGRAAGIGVGVAAAVTLTPLLFIPYLWLSGRRRAAVTASITALSVTAGAWVLDPGDSRRFWLHDVLDPARIVHVDITANQSLRAALTRTGLPLLSPDPVWLPLTVATAVAGIATAVALSRRGDHYPP